MSRFSPQTQYQPPRPLDFSAITGAIDDVQANGLRRRQLAIQEQDAADRHASRIAERDASSHVFDPTTDIPDYAGLQSRIGEASDRIGAATSYDQNTDARGVYRPQAVAPTPSALLSRIHTGLGITPQAPIGGGALGLHGSRTPAVPAPGEAPGDPQAIERALKSILPSRTGLDEDGAMRVYEPWRAAAREIAPGMIAQQLNEHYRQRKADDDRERKATPFLGQTNPQTGKPFSIEEARALVSNPAFASFTFRESPEDKVARQKELAAFVASLRPPTSQYSFPVGADADGNPVVLRGNTRTGALEPTGIAGRAPASQGRVTDGQRTAGGLLSEIDAAAGRLGSLGSREALNRMADKAGWLGNYAKTDEGQIYDQTANQFLNNLIYVKTGKAATNAERDALRQTYIAEPGDSDATIAAKARARAEAVAGARIIAGGAAPATAKDAGSPSAGKPAAATATIDEMIRAGKSDAEIRAALKGRP